MTASTEERQAARAYTNGVLNLDMSTLKTALDGAYGEAYATGLMVAAQQTGISLPDLGSGMPTDEAGWTSFWDKWTPGNAPAADMLREGGLGDLLAQTGTTIKGIEGTSLDLMGTVLADGVASGASVDAIARRMGDVLDDPARAFRIADTEMSRAVSAASMDGYTAAGIAKVEWLVSPGACQLCLSHAAGSPFLLLDAPIQPAHPICRCSYSPVDPGTGASTGDTIEGDVGDSGMNDLPGFGTTGEDTVSSLTSDAFKPMADVEMDGGEVIAPKMDSAFEKWAQELSTKERGALTDYMGEDTYGPLNTALRSGGDASSFESSGESLTKLLDSAIKSGEAPQDMVVYRGVQESVINDLKVGDKFIDQGYSSTTVSREKAIDFTSPDFSYAKIPTYSENGQVLEIQVPKGSPMAWMDAGARDIASEGEALLGRGGSYTYVGVNSETGSPILRYEASSTEKKKVAETAGREVGGGSGGFDNPISAEKAGRTWSYPDGSTADASQYSIENTRGLYKATSDVKLDSSFKDWGLSPAENKALLDYQDRTFLEINSSLRSGGMGGTFADDIPLLDRAVASGAAPENMTVYRGVDEGVVKGLKIGDRITDSGFASTSTDKGMYEEFTGNWGESKGTLLTIQVPQGSPMSWMNALDGADKMGMEWQKEVLLGRGGNYTYMGVDKVTKLPVLRYEAGMTEKQVAAVKDVVQVGTRDQSEFGIEHMTVEANGVEQRAATIDSRRTGYHDAFTKSEEEAVNKYASGQTFFDIRTAFNAGEKYALDDGSNLFTTLDSALEKSVLKTDTMLYRTMKVTPDWFANLKQGSVIENPFYVSTSNEIKGMKAYGASSAKGQKQVLMQILTPKGIHTVAGYTNEWILPRGTNFFVRTTEQIGNKFYLTVEVIP